MAGGRPTIYTEKLANEICHKIATSWKGLKQLCHENSHWPRRETIHCWVLEKPEFSNKYQKAKEFQMDWLAEEALEIAFDNSKDYIEDSNGNIKCNLEYVNRSRLKVDTIKWFTSKLKPKKYGEVKDKSELTPQDVINQILNIEKNK